MSEMTPEPTVESSQVEAVPWVPPAPMAAAPVHVAHSPLAGKTRNPWGVWLLGFTAVYPIIWYFKVNRELRDFSPSINVQPGLSVVAMFIPFFGLVSWIKTTGRIQTAQKLAGSGARCSAILSIVTLFFGMVYVQSQMNKVWDRYGNPPQGTPLA